MKVRIRPGRRSDSAGFLGLVEALADFERLEPPSRAGRRRLLDDIFRKRRVQLLVASEDRRLVGYALYFFSYSSFVARPTLYIEDIFVLKERRGEGIGLALFKKCAREAARLRCGRMEWAVLRWNKGAISFYEKLGAKAMDDWQVMRLDDKGVLAVADGRRHATAKH